MPCETVCTLCHGIWGRGGCHGNKPYGRHYYFISSTSLSDRISPFDGSRQLSVLSCCTLCRPPLEQLRADAACVAGGPGRREGSAEEVDDLPEGPAPVLAARRRLPLQHNPGHVRADAQPGRLEEHCVLWSLHISVVRPRCHYLIGKVAVMSSDVLQNSNVFRLREATEV